MEYIFPEHKRGDTFSGATFTVTVNGTPLNLVGATIKMSLKTDPSPSAASALDLTTANAGIVITDGAGGVFQVAPAIISIPAGIYAYDIQITLATGAVKTYISGTWTITQDIA